MRNSPIHPILLDSLQTDSGDPMLLGDGLHLTAAGHGQVARRLYPRILELAGRN